MRRANQPVAVKHLPVVVNQLADAKHLLAVTPPLVAHLLADVKHPHVILAVTRVPKSAAVDC